MLEELIVAGFGGQGVLSLGMTLAYAGMVEEKEISWMPSYGPEMRGGTANCITILSTKKISSPIISKFDSAIILNQPSMDKFAAKIKPGGLLLYESGNIFKPSIRTDIEIIGIPATTEAIKMKNAKIMNMIILGAYLSLKPVVKNESILEALKKVLPEKYHHLLAINKQALEKGEAMIHELKIQTVG
ncbi:MAG: 2-oxoacid:acceptor oxidoreductase family protein [Chitinophagaceae bacterium]|nr:2-oxoacid:acceptor oxidoreductase family protein [Chitinophagaceae bacterium]MBK9570863.1 2-oxoacid:acceptor oxidoreductase family protein [Chitinophagaceae bacterium]MBL0130389.1 2-oxoacid:acceptor oxidoreductase family protein [Chitinophagaceae bacterium]MBL0272457.1 2-oxoacid:acceptor oxidoreductase family protein [Chitinophagaceae bacterium]